ncbi:MAG TPA: D-alanine--D-alanine ligase [Verrucomicrobia bacterium]|nr:D-alanine--D-alanine ligase [Verrucomicrobiales bacterium]HIL54759.1 D-alanine--D-alanine ligase [Verrucomicrobiota bacterium]
MSFSDKTIAVIMGGPGNEREVSMASGKGVSQSLSEKGATVIEICIEDRNFELNEEVDLVFNVIHGTFGEDGSLQKILNERRVPYTGAGATSSELAFDKGLSKKCFVENGVSTPLFEFVSKDDGVLPSLNKPFVIKPPKEGSSVGVHIIKNEESISEAIEDAAKYDDIILVEEFINGKELTVGVLNGEALPIVHIQPHSGFYDMKNKYPWLGGGKGSEYFCPAELDDETTNQVQGVALEAHKALGVEIYSRVDIILSEDGNPYVLEVNTIPGMTETSLLPKAAKANGIEFGDLCQQIAELSMRLRKK